jgi:hypothetical protein
LTHYCQKNYYFLSRAINLSLKPLFFAKGKEEGILDLSHNVASAAPAIQELFDFLPNSTLGMIVLHLCMSLHVCYCINPIVPTPFACINCNKTYVTSNELIIFSTIGKYVEYLVFSEEYKIV